MLSFLTMWGLRRQLIKACEQERVLQLYMAPDQEEFLASIREVGWFTFTFDALDLDEKTWLATHTFPLAYIQSIDHDSVERVKARLEDQFNEGDVPYLFQGDEAMEIFEVPDDEEDEDGFEAA